MHMSANLSHPDQLHFPPPLPPTPPTPDIFNEISKDRNVINPVENINEVKKEN